MHIIKNNIIKKSKLIKYFFGGGMAFLADFSILYILTNYIGLFYIISNIISYISGTLINFYLNKKYTFQNEYKKHYKQLSIFFAISLTNLIISSIILFLLVKYVGLSYLIAKIIATGACFMINFLGHKHITFNILK